MWFLFFVLVFLFFPLVYSRIWLVLAKVPDWLFHDVDDSTKSVLFAVGLGLCLSVSVSVSVSLSLSLLNEPRSVTQNVCSIGHLKASYYVDT